MLSWRRCRGRIPRNIHLSSPHTSIRTKFLHILDKYNSMSSILHPDFPDIYDVANLINEINLKLKDRYVLLSFKWTG